MADRTETRDVDERDRKVPTGMVRNFIEHRKAEGKALALRLRNHDEAVDMAESFWKDYDMGDINARAEEYRRRTGESFRVPLHRFSYMPGAFQYPFVEVAPGIRMTLREMTEGEERRGPRDGGRVTGYALVVAHEDLPGPVRRDPDTYDVTGEAVFATFPSADGLIDFKDGTISGDPVLAEEADQEALEHLDAIQEGLLEMLGNPATDPGLRFPD